MAGAGSAGGREVTMTWEIWAIVLAIGFSVSFLRAIKRRMRSRAIRHEPVELQVTAVGLGTPRGQSLEIWMPVGTALPVHHRRILRVPSKADQLVVSIHTDDSRLEPFATLHIGPVGSARLVELVIRASERGRVGFAAREKASGHRIKMRVETPSKRKPALTLPTRDAPPEGSGMKPGDSLADISWHSVEALK